MLIFSYQRAVGDLKSAGLNPMLAYSQGGATTPNVGAASSVSPASGSTASGPMATYRKSDSAQLAIHAAQAAAGIKLTEAQAAKTRAEEGYVLAQTDHSRASAVEVKTRTTKLAAEIPQIITNIDKAKSEIKLNETRGLAMGINSKLQEAQTVLIETQKALMNGQLSEAQARTRLHAVRSNLEALQIPGAENQAAHDRSWVGRAAPYVNSAGSATRVLGNVIGGIKSAVGTSETEYSQDETIRTKHGSERVRSSTRTRR